MRSIVCAAIVALALSSATPLQATVVTPIGVPDLVGQAALIVRGRITDLRAVIPPEGGIATMATVAVTTTLKGDAGPFVAVRVPGGVIGRDRVVTIGAPVLRIDEEAIFFLERGPDHLWQPLGLSAGVVAVRADAVSGAPVVMPPVLAGRTASVGPVVRGDVRRRPMAVESFESIVRIVLAAQRGVKTRAAR
ncbi:MAG TPA: hypothetical protein VHD57_13570 [Vicinamibacterales bacterium]|jgi:hypothetical protein|nr:hypothetical protein [Vicinamibacterales bacterium]